jgi:hypothetical protein
VVPPLVNPVSGYRYFLRMQESPEGRLALAGPTGEELPRPSRWRSVVRRLLTVVVIAAVTFGLFWCYLLESRTQGADADSAGMALQGWDMVHNGNLLLRGWFEADVSFYTFEVPMDGLVEVFYGLRTDVVHVAAAIEYALLVLFAALLAAGSARDRRFGGREGLIRALVAVGVMVTPGTWQGAGVLLGEPDHTAVGVPVLITLLIVDRVRPRRWLLASATVVAVGVLLVWAQLDDPIGTLSSALPLAVVCGLSVAAFLIAATVRRIVGGVRRWRGRRDEAAEMLPTRLSQPARHGAESPGYDAALAVVAAGSFGVTELLVKAIWHAGGYYLRAIPAGTQVSGFPAVPGHLQALGENLLILFGANFWVGVQPQTAFAYLHLVCAAVALLSALITIAGWRRADRVTRALVVGILIMTAAGAASPLMIPLGGAHDVAVMLPLGAVLGGRVIGRWLATRRAGTEWFARSVSVARVTAGCALAAVGLGLLAGLGYAAAQPGIGPKYQPLADALAEDGLTSGLSGYWEANITTLVTGGKVHVAPLISAGKYGYLWVSKAAWFDPDVSYANFIVTTTQQLAGNDFSMRQAIVWYGEPALTYQFGPYTILVYDRNLLETVVQPTPSQLYAPPGLDGEGRTRGEIPPPAVSVRNGI